MKQCIINFYNFKRDQKFCIKVQNHALVSMVLKLSHLNVKLFHLCEVCLI